MFKDKQFLNVLNYWLAHDEHHKKLNDFIYGVRIENLKKRYDLRKWAPILEEYIEGGFRVIRFRDVKDPLYYPVDLPRPSLDLVIWEMTAIDNGHYYEKEWTTVKDDIVLDCGAAEGLFALFVKDRSRQVHVIEPLPGYQPGLERTFGSDKKVRLLQAAMGLERKSVHFSCDKALLASKITEGPSDIRVEQTTVDQEFYEAGKELTYLKADIEGSEIDMLLGATKTIRKCSPRIAITTYHLPWHAGKIMEVLRDINPGYRFKTTGMIFDRKDRQTFPIMLHAWT